MLVQQIYHCTLHHHTNTCKDALNLFYYQNGTTTSHANATIMSKSKGLNAHDSKTQAANTYTSRLTERGESTRVGATRGEESTPGVGV